jgi:hypothetical protein
MDKIEKQFMKDYLKWTKSNRKSPAPIYPPELGSDNNIGDDEWIMKIIKNLYLIIKTIKKLI